MKSVILLFFCTLAFLTASGRAEVTVAWANYPGGVSIAVDGSDNIYTAYGEYNPGGDISLTRWNAAGNIVWQVSYNNTDNSRHELATWVETDSEGNILISGTIRSGYSNPVNAASLLMKYNPSGTLLWRRVFESDFDGSSTRKCLVDAQNNIYVLGLGHSGVGMVTKVKKFSPNGDPLWSYFDNVGIGAPVNFKFTPDNNIVISGRAIYGSFNGYAKIDLAGNTVWSLAGVSSLTTGDAAGDGFGNTYVIHGQYVSSNAGSVVKKLSPTGTLIWERINTLSGFRVEVGTDQNPIISGFPSAGSFGAAFMKYDSNGSVLWQNLDADGPSLALLAHGQMKLDGQNAVYLAASIMTAMAVCKVNSDGSSGWTTTMPTGYASVLDFGTDNSVYVVGGTTTRLTQDGATIPPPVAAFSGSPTSGYAPLTVNFSDQSSGDISSWSWTFGDGATAAVQNPAHTFTDPGTYTVSLSVANSGGSSSLTKTNCITVTAAQQNAIHVAEIAVTRELSGGKSGGKARVKVVDENGIATPGVTVTGNWSGAATGSATFTTGSDGWGQTVTKRTRTSSHYTFCVTSLAKTGYTYDAATNGVNCVRSDGTVWETLANVSLESLVASEQADDETMMTNYPNPFNPATMIEYSVPSRTDVTIEIFNALGQKVRTLVNDTKSAGSYRIEWNGDDDSGRPVSTGVYLYRLQAGDVVQTKKMLLIK